MDIGKQLRKVRIEKELSQTDIVRRSGITSTYVSRVECGRKVPSLKVLERWAQALEVTLSELFSDHFSQLPIPKPINPEPVDRATLELLRLFNQLPGEDRKLLLFLARKMASAKLSG